MKKVIVGLISRTVNGKKEYLLVSSKKDFGKFTGMYYLPGGHLKEGESELECLRREIMEELGIEVISVKKITKAKIDIEGELGVWYSCEVKSFQINENNAELKDARFFTKDNMSKIRLWPATKKFFEKYIN